jgi:hypothetical protein
VTTCVACQPPEPVPDARLLDHVRLMHPGVWDGLDRWPDGQPVIIDDTLQPADFT